MDLRNIRSFVAVYEEGSINRAAMRLNCAQPSLSLQLRNLEARLSIVLFERHARGVRPTPAAVQFYQHSITILGEVKNAEQHMRSWAKEISGSLTVGLISTVTKSVLPQVLTDFTENFPHVDIRIVEGYSGTLTDWVISGELDFAIVNDPQIQDGLSLKALSTEELVVTSGPNSNLIHLKPISLKNIPARKWVIPSEQHSLRGILKRYNLSGDIAVDRLLEMDGLFGALEFIHKSDWAGIFPISTIIDEMHTGRFTINPILNPSMTIDFYLINQKQRPLNQAANVLVDNLQTALKITAESWSKSEKYN